MATFRAFGWQKQSPAKRALLARSAFGGESGPRFSFRLTRHPASLRLAHGRPVAEVGQPAAARSCNQASRRISNRTQLIPEPSARVPTATAPIFSRARCDLTFLGPDEKDHPLDVAKGVVEHQRLHFAVRLSAPGDLARNVQPISTSRCSGSRPQNRDEPMSAPSVVSTAKAPPESMESSKNSRNTSTW